MDKDEHGQGVGVGQGLAIAGLCVGGFLLVREALKADKQKAQQLANQLQLARREMAISTARPAPEPRANAAGDAAPRLAPRTYDDVFAQHGQGIPVPYLRALALKESGMNPSSKGGAAWGLMQVVEVVRKDFNQRRHSTYSRNDLLDPTINVTIAASALATILHSYARNHPQVLNLQTNWSNPRFVELATFGWNAGWSERGGVGRVARYLEQRGIYDITIDSVHQAARAAGASEHLSNAAKVRWCKGVVAQYLRELEAEPPEIEMPGEYVGTDRPVVIIAGEPRPDAGPVRYPCKLESPSSTPDSTSAPPPASAPAPSPSGGGLIDPYADVPVSGSPAVARPCPKGDRHA
jgi:hypothetical protein